MILASLRVYLRCVRTARTSKAIDQAIAVTRPPAPAHPRRAPGPAPAPETPRAPGPGHPPRHRTGGTEYTIRAYNCGCILMWDGQGRLTGTTPCGSDLDEELRNLTP